jgi:hypothetical protein
MPFHQINPEKRIEIFYMTEELCKNYNEFHGLREFIDKPITPGYYYENMIGPFLSVPSAISHARENHV